MNTDFTRSLGRNLALVAVLALTPTVAHADLIGDLMGDEVDGAIVGGPGAFVVVPPWATVGAGVEFTIEFVGTPAFEIDIGAVSVHLYSVFGARISTGAGEVLVLSDLDGVLGDFQIIGITNFQTNEGPDITESDVTWTDHTVSLNMSPNIWEVDGFVSFDLVKIPAPSALALLGVAGLIGGRRRRR